MKSHDVILSKILDREPLAAGGEVLTIDYLEGYSTTAIEQRLRGFR